MAAHAFRIIFDRTQGTLEYQRLVRKKAAGSYYFIVLANLTMIIRTITRKIMSNSNSNMNSNVNNEIFINNNKNR